MNDEQIVEQLSGALQHRSDDCERGIIAIGEFAGCAFGFALVAPDCVIFSQQFGPFIFDLCLN